MQRKIKTSKKYKPLYEKTIARVVSRAISKYGEKDAEKEARNMLHQIWGAYYGIRPDFKKAFRKLENELKEGKDKKEAIKTVLKLHSSTNERIGVLDEFYKKIFEITGAPKTIIDHACGLNPLTILWMNLGKDTIYQAFDIDEEEISFLKQTLDLLRPTPMPEIATGDLLEDEFPRADVALFLKTYPVLEMEEKGNGMKVIEKQQCNYAVVSFPTKSIGGKEKGMEKFYAQQLETAAKTKNWEIKKLSFKTELVFVIKKQ